MRDFDWSFELACVVFVIWSVFAFNRWRGDVAVCVVVISGWLLLPIAPKGQFFNESSAFPYWLIGLALPSQIGVSKSMAIGAVALLGSLSSRSRDWRSFRLSWFDLPVLVWCVWPFFGLADSESARPGPGFSVGYLSASWGCLWILARVHFCKDDSRIVLARALGWATVLCIPFAVLEGFFNFQIYSHLVEIHPFAEDGRVRYVFFRPLGFFEDGNQYGIWVCAGALSAYASILTGARKKLEVALFGVCCVVALLSQSVGALILAGAGMAASSFWLRLRLDRVLAVASVIVLVFSTAYLSGTLPIERVTRTTAIGQKGLEMFRSMGRGSFPWRISQDQKALPLVKPRVIEGNHQWDWWRPIKARPWGLVMLALGQFGLVGMLAMSLIWLLPAATVLMRRPLGLDPDATSVILGLVVGISFLDALMNSFVYFPSLLAAGALATPVVLHRRNHHQPVDDRARERFEPTPKRPIRPMSLDEFSPRSDAAHGAGDRR